MDAVTVDFWNTIVVASAGGPERKQLRMDRLAQVLNTQGRRADDALLQRAYSVVLKRFSHAWLQEHLTPPTDQLLTWLWNELEVTIPEAEHEETVRCFQESLLAFPPTPAVGVEDALRRLSARYPLAIISDTMLSPGKTIRILLKRMGLAGYFNTCVFSDEVGCAKPDPRVYELAASRLGTTADRLMHIGDLRRTDVAGALGIGARAVLYTGIQHDESGGPDPHHELATWSGIEDILE